MTYRARCSGRKGHVGRRRVRLGKSWIQVLGTHKLRDRKLNDEGRELDRIRLEEPERWAKLWGEDYQSEYPKTGIENNNECKCVCWRCIADEPDCGNCEYACQLKERKTIRMVNT